MPGLIDRLAKIVQERIRTIGCERPSLPVLKLLLETAYHSTLRTEEGRFIRSSITYLNPHIRPEDGPATRRADYPGVWSLGRRVPLTVERLVKLARAIDVWSGSIAVYGTKVSELRIWGVIDQLVAANIRLHQEGSGGSDNPGILTITTDGVGDLTVYHQSILLGGLRGHQLFSHENDALGSLMVGERIWPYLEEPAEAVARVLESIDGADSQQEQMRNLIIAWINAVSRLCIGLRRFGTGGALLITPSPYWDHLEVGYQFRYNRLGDSIVLNVLDEEYRDKSRDFVRDDEIPDYVPYGLVLEARLAEADAEDRETELAGAVKVVTSLASVDGLVLLSPLLHVHGFGVKIGTGLQVGTVYDGAEFERRRTKAKKIDPSRFGTRHNSVLRYCRTDREAVGVVVSQDGHVRIVLSAGRSLVLWDNVKLLDYRPFTAASVKILKDWVKNHERTKRPTLGYTDTPKTLTALLRVLDKP
jgi:hypothetical protein